MFTVVPELSVESISTLDTACKAVRIWRDRPNVVNRRLCGSSDIWTQNKINSDCCLIDTLFQKLVEAYPNFCLEEINHFKTIFEVIAGENDTSLCKYRKVSTFSSGDNECSLQNARLADQRSNCLQEVVMRKLLPRSLVKFKTTLEVVATMKDHDSETTWFIPICTVDGGQSASTPLVKFSYGIRYTQFSDKIGRIELLVTDSFHSGELLSGTLCANLEWLKETLVPKLKAWAEKFKVEDVNLSQEKSHSLALVDIEEYTKIYNEMKLKYAESLIKSWEENTDPQKFVFEDIAIASYLMVLWEQENRDENCKKKQNFVDLGCGNGLLVYLLTSEGYQGQGIDIRKRKIWDLYGENIHLEERPLHPNSCKFDNIDWIIGNHSDELTPWIPVIAARSSYHTKYFLLPCCFHDFTGKFTKNCHDSSQYHTYLDYVIQIGEECGFIVEKDIQRIPSTKRICHIARKRRYSESDQGLIDEKIQWFLGSKNCHLTLDDRDMRSQSQYSGSAIDVSSNSTGNQFHPREAKEKVRNCTRIDKDVRNSIVVKIFDKLLASENVVGGEEGAVTSKGYPVASWNAGGRLPIEDAICLIEKEQLSQLKSQCGGLQTLLRNHGHIFEVMRGEVFLRNYRTKQERRGKKKKQCLQAERGSNFKTKLCWYHLNHPQGCILLDRYCQFAHSEAELRYPKDKSI